MTYPVKFAQALAIGQSVSVPFAPLKAGLVKAIVTAGWNPADSPPPSEGQPTTFPMQLRLDIFKPGAAKAAATRTDGKIVGSDPKRDLGKPQVTLWADAMAGPTDVGLGEGSDALAFLPVSMFGDGTTQIVQLRSLNGRLGMAVYTPQLN